MSADHDPTTTGGARRCHLAIVFSDVSDSTILSAVMEADHDTHVLARLRGAYQDVVCRHGGTVARLQGHGLLAMFGYPDAQEDAGRRAAEAALELHAQVRSLRLDPPLPQHAALTLRTGIHLGLVLLDTGDVFRGRFDLLGKAPNLAARICEAARSDEILVSEGTLGAEAHFFRTGPRRMLTLKGFPGHVPVQQIEARATTRTRFEARLQRGRTPFIGRTQELALLERALEETLAGSPQFLGVSAPAGVGKTRLVDEFLRRAVLRNVRVLRGYCESHLSAEPLQPLLQMVRILFGLERRAAASVQEQAMDRGLDGLGGELTSIRNDLLQALSLSGAAEAQPRGPASIVAAFRTLLVHLSERDPLVLFIDDWQWADAATRQVLGAIQPEQRRILVVLATRGFAPDDAAMSDTRVLDLAPFSDEEAAAAIAQLLPDADPFLAGKIQAHAGGNALFLEDLCHAVANEQASNGLRGVPEGAASLAALIEARVARLPEQEAEVVRTAAVIGNVVPAWLLERITGYSQQHPVIAALARHDLMFPGETPGSLRFKHGLTRDAIYDGIGLHQRRAMHLRVAELLRDRATALTDREMSEELAYHYGAAGRQPEVARFAEIAGDKAMVASALDRAQVHYRAALAALDALPMSPENDRRWSVITQRLGTAFVFDPARDQLDVLHRAVSRASARGDQTAVGRAEYWLGHINYALGESGAAIEHCERALTAAQTTGDEALAVETGAILGLSLASAAEYERALHLLGESIAVKLRERTGPRRAAGLAHALACKAYALADTGRFAEAYPCFDGALEAVRGLQHEVEASVLCWRSAVQVWQGRFEEGRRDALAAQRVAERTKTLYLFGMGRALAAYAEWSLGRSDQALQNLLLATSWLETRDKCLFISLNYGWLAEALVASGRIDEARRHAAKALRRMRKRDQLGAPMTYRALARAAGPRSQWVQRYLDLAMKAARRRRSRHEIAVTQLCAAEIDLACGERGHALDLLDEATVAFEAMGMGWHVEEAYRLRNGR